MQPASLSAAVEQFAESCNNNQQLTRMNSGWNRVIRVVASDTGETYTVTTRDGQVTAAPGRAGQADMEVEATADLLEEIFTGELSPTEPYADGTLIVRGSEQDVLHLDFITAMLWG